MKIRKFKSLIHFCKQWHQQRKYQTCNNEPCRNTFPSKIIILYFKTLLAFCIVLHLFIHKIIHFVFLTSVIFQQMSYLESPSSIFMYYYNTFFIHNIYQLDLANLQLEIILLEIIRFINNLTSIKMVYAILTK